jgi:hypothetical protein
MGESRHGHGRVTAVSRERLVPDVLVRDGQATLAVQWCASTGVNATTGAPLSPKSCMTHHRVTADNVAEGAPAGRGRGTIANANHKGLQTKGDPMAHNLGHGQPSLAAMRLSLHLLALLCHTVLAWSDAQYPLLRPVLARRQTFFEDIRALRRSMVCDRWQELMAVMLRGLALASRLAPLPAPQCDTS